MKSIVDLLPNHCAILYSQMIRIRMYSFSSKRLYHLGGAFEHCIECLINQFVDYINWCSFWFLFWLIKRDKINGMQRFLKKYSKSKNLLLFSSVLRQANLHWTFLSRWTKINIKIEVRRWHTMKYFYFVKKKHYHKHIYYKMVLSDFSVYESVLIWI